MAKNPGLGGRIPPVMKRVSASQLVVDSELKAGKPIASLLTNRGNFIDYVISSGIAPPPQQIVYDNGESTYGDGKSWILMFEKPRLISGIYDPGLAVRVFFGVGGVRESITVNASPGFELVIPSDSIDVQVLSLSNPPVALDSVTRCTAQIHRAIPSGAENAHLSVVAPAASGAGLTIQVPSFANDLGIYGSEVGVPGAGAAIFQPAALLFIFIGASGVPPIVYTGTTLLAMFRAGQRITLPGNATHITMTYPIVLVDSFLVDFGI